jgi:hypothetical protein
MHDRLPFAHEVVPELIAGGREGGMEFCTVDEWVKRPEEE